MKIINSTFSLTVIGSGSIVPTADRGPASFLLRTKNVNILLDAGPGTMRKMIDIGVSIHDFDYIFISHFHTDHFGDAFNLIHTRWIDDNYNNRPHKKLTFICPKGTRARYELWRKIYWVEPEEYYPVEFLEGPMELQIEDVSLATFLVSHVRWFSSEAISIVNGGKKLVYTGDIGSDNDLGHLTAIVKNADLLITEASYAEPTPNHYTIEQVKKLSEVGQVKKVLVVHTRPQHVKTVEAVCAHESRFIMGKDGLDINL